MTSRLARQSIAANNGPRKTPSLLPGLLSVKQAAAYLGISQAWLYQSDVPWVRLGRRRLYDPDSLRAYITRHSSHAASER